MRSKLLSLLLHALAFVLGLWLPQRLLQPTLLAPAPQNPPIRLHLNPLPRETPEPGGGGNRSPIAPTRGSFQVARHVFVPPTARVINLDPELVLEPALTVQLDSSLVFPTPGDPRAAMGPPSAGTGRNGLGAEGEGGVGDRPGRGIMRGDAGFVTSDPELIKRTEPEYSEEARKARISGVVVLRMVVGVDGKPGAIGVVQGLGLGLDEKAIEAVSKWRFRPARRGARAVATTATIYVNFRLL